MKRKILLSVAVVAVLLVGCKKNTNEQKIEISRYEKAIFSIDPKNVKQDLSALFPEYEVFLGHDYMDTNNILRIYNFITDPEISNIYETTMEVYPDLDFLEAELGAVFNNIKKYYPDFTVPKVYTYVSGLDLENPVIYFDTTLIIALDLFLGDTQEVYLKAGIPQYKINRLTKDHILPQCAVAIADNYIKTPDKNNTLLDLMLLAGKEMYFLDAALPMVAPEYKIGFTKQQWEWAEANEKNIWRLLIQEQLLYSTNRRAIVKFMSDAPFTKGMDEAAPARLGVYIGWKIINSYMKTNNSVSLSDIMNNTDSQNILNQSGYKP
ncbi:MAG: hypothetical protein PHP31_06120 [Lentimicrobiaceae bacterium]|nr:hypothetical protein [Lentimicrobiaceae bacterium]